MKTITVFTPTYNRGYLLPQLYKSLIVQTNKDFIWLIIDDGSIDDTQELVEKWQEENKVTIQYIYQENQGMHVAHNTAYKNIKTELNVCIDSDDFMPNNAIETILDFWSNNNDKNIAGIIGLDADKKGKIIGTKIPDYLREVTLSELYQKHKVKGDKKLVYRTDIINKYQSYPIFIGEKFVPLDYKYILIDQDYKLLPLNKVLCIVEYLDDGSTQNIFKQYVINPKGFAFSRKVRMKYASNFKELFRNAIHYVSSSILLKNWSFVKESPKKAITILAIPFGILLYFYIKIKTIR